MAKENYYEILGLSFETTYEEIKAAYRRLAFELHPDKNPTAEAAARFQEVMQAYTVLIDAESRGSYDSEFITISPVSGKDFNLGTDLNDLYSAPRKDKSTPSEFSLHLKRYRRRKNLFQTAVILLLISILALYGLKPSKVSSDSMGSVQQTDTSTSINQNNSGSAVNKPGLNQRLIIVQGLQGPIGLPGPAGADGPAGRDGQPGAAGAAGVAGAAGQQGAVGPAGPMGPVGPAGSGGTGGGVTIESFAGSQGSCTNGGTKFTATDGTITYACNGTSSSGAGGSFAAGTTGFISCDADPYPSGNSNITIALQTQFTNGQFKIKQFDVTDISSNCSGKTMTFALTVTIVDPNPPFSTIVASISCTKSLTNADVGAGRTIIDGNSTCSVTSPFTLSGFSIAVLDATGIDNIGVQIS